MVAVIPSEEQVIEWITSLSNWGRWGEEDQAGCLNLITPEKRKQAAALIHDGTTVSCARPITTEITPDVIYQTQRYMVDSGEGRDTELGTDTSHDVRPSHYANIATPLHTVSLVGLGLWLIDNANLEQLAAACQQRQRYTFMLCMGPLRLRRVTGSPVNPIALF